MNKHHPSTPASLRSACVVPIGSALLALSLFNLHALAAGPELVVAISLDIPPYVMQSATKGIEVDIVHAVLPDYTVRFIQLPYKELETAVPQKRADAAVSVHEAEEGVFYSKEFITFSNYAISKKAAGLTVDRIADLKKHAVLAWQDAYLELGPEFEHIFSPQSPQRKNYVEVADQREQVRMFWQGKGDVIVIDHSVFSYFSGEMGHAMSEVTLHSLFPEVTNFKVGFKKAAVRDEFNRGLIQLCQNGEYAKVLTRYRVDVPHTVCDEYVPAGVAMNTRTVSAAHGRGRRQAL